VDGETILCAYHGWTFAADGRCRAMPAEPQQKPALLARCGARVYRAAALGGLGFGDLGSASAPWLSHWDLLVWRDRLRDIGRALAPCNWLQIMENSVDPSHIEWLHGRKRSAAAFPTRRALDLGVALSDRALLAGTARVRKVWEKLDSGEPAVALATVVTWC
jgi:phenylpropionate dioxygenase-like ring-hydroxylating dioxygenase large terminal subunit